MIGMSTSQYSFSQTQMTHMYCKQLGFPNWLSVCEWRTSSRLHSLLRLASTHLFAIIINGFKQYKPQHWPSTIFFLLHTFDADLYSNTIQNDVGPNFLSLTQFPMIKKSGGTGQVFPPHFGPNPNTQLLIRSGLRIRCQGKCNLWSRAWHFFIRLPERTSNASRLRCESLIWFKLYWAQRILL